jgi:4-hydroxybenzoate polyprenyltransferase
MATVCAEASMAYCCRQDEFQCADRDLRARSFYLAVLYQFFRETSCDIRDIPEDTKEGLRTLPVKLGKQNTILLLATVGVLAESILTHGIDITTTGIIVKAPLISRAFLRVGLTMAAYWQVLRFPRQNSWAWGSMSLLGLTPVLFAQAALRG